MPHLSAGERLGIGGVLAARVELEVLGRSDAGLLAAAPVCAEEPGVEEVGVGVARVGVQRPAEGVVGAGAISLQLVGPAELGERFGDTGRLPDELLARPGELLDALGVVPLLAVDDAELQARLGVLRLPVGQRLGELGGGIVEPALPEVDLSQHHHQPGALALSLIHI